MSANLISALLLYTVTFVLGYTLLHVLFGRRLRERRTAALQRAKEEKEQDRTPEDGSPESYCHPAINDVMGYEFIKVVRPDILAPDTEKETTYEESAGTGATPVTIVTAESRENSFSLGDDDDDGGYRYPAPAPAPAPADTPSEDEFFDNIPFLNDIDIFDEMDNEELERQKEQFMEMKEEMDSRPDRFQEYYEQHRDEVKLADAFSVPAEGEEMNEYQRSALAMEEEIGKNSITLEDIERSIDDAKEKNKSDELPL